MPGHNGWVLWRLFSQLPRTNYVIICQSQREKFMTSFSSKISFLLHHPHPHQCYVIREWAFQDDHTLADRLQTTVQRVASSQLTSCRSSVARPSSNHKGEQFLFFLPHWNLLNSQLVGTFRWNQIYTVQIPPRIGCSFDYLSDKSVKTRAFRIKRNLWFFWKFNQNNVRWFQVSFRRVSGVLVTW